MAVNETLLNGLLPTHIRIGTLAGFDVEKERCEMLMQFLGWSYELLVQHNIGHINSTEPKASTGFVGQLINGHLDMICSTVLMKSTSLQVLDFTYPTSGGYRDIYLYHNTAGLIHQTATIAKPFALSVWLMVFCSIITAIAVFSLMQVIIKGFVDASALRIVQDGIAWWSQLSLGINCGDSRLAEFNFVSVKLATIMWLLLWGPVVLQLYQANLKTYLSVADRLVLPFTEFDGFIHSLRTGAFRLLIYDELSLMPSCPSSYGTVDDCNTLLNRILEAHPSIRGSIIDLRMADMPDNVVHGTAYPDSSIPDKISLYIDGESPKSNVIAIRSDKITRPSGGFPLRPGFPYRRILNDAVISLQLAFQTVDRFRNGNLMLPLRFDPIPMRSPFSMFQLVPIFELLGIGLALSLAVFLAECCMKRRLCWTTNRGGNGISGPSSTLP